MFEHFGEYLNQLSEEKDISLDLLREVVEETLKQALKKKYDNQVNFLVEFDEKNNPTMYKAVTVVDEVEAADREMSLEEAKKIVDEIEVGEEVWLRLDEIGEFGRIESTLAKNTFFQRLNELEKNIIYNEFKRREFQLVNGYFQREYRGTIYVNLGKTEGILLRRDQSPREHYTQGDRIRAYIYNVDNNRAGPPSIFLTRAKPEFIKKLFEIEIPEITDKIVDIVGIVRQPGLKTKIAVTSNKIEVDPVGACVGQKGVRIQSIIKEIEGEKIDIIKWSKDIREFISNAIAPAKATRVIITDPEYHKAIIVVPDDQLSLAIGKGGYNIRMTGELVGYSLDVKTETDIKEDPSLVEDIVAVNQIFVSEEDERAIEEEYARENERSNLYSLEGLPEETLDRLVESGIDSIEKLYNMSQEEVVEQTGLAENDVELLLTTMKESVEIVEEDEEGESDEHRTRIEEEVVEEIEIYECPNCGSEITEGMEKCPKCGIEICFE